MNKTKLTGAIGALGLSAAILGAGLSPVIAAVRELQSSPGAAYGAVSQDVVGTLQTPGNKPITVNGSQMPGGGTILSGASITTPAEVSASVSLGAVGSLDISPASSLSVEFSASRVNVTLVSGCVVLRTTPGTAAAINQGGKEITRADNGGTLDVCIGADGNPVMNQGAAASAGAGVPGGVGIDGSIGQVSTAGGGTGLFGLGNIATVAIVGGALGVGTVMAKAASNDAPASPASPIR